MYPIIFKLGPFTAYSYGFMLVIAFLASTLLAGLEAERNNIDPQVIFSFSFLVFIFGVIGSRIFYVVENFAFYLRNPLEILMLQHGGLSWFGGLIFGVIAGIRYLKKKKLSVYATFDLVIPFVALGQAIGRIGCLLNGCCFGRESLNFGIYFNVHNSVLIPTQIYSSLILLFIFIVLRSLQNKPLPQGQILFLYLLLYSIQRFFIEFLRADNQIIFGGLTLFQIISIAIFIIAIIKLFLISRTSSPK